MAVECRHTLQTIRQGMGKAQNQHELIVVTEDELPAADTSGCRLQANARERLSDAADAVAEAVVGRVRRYGEQAVRELFGPRHYRGTAYLPRL